MLIKRKSIEAEANHRSGPEKSPKVQSRKKIKYAPITLSEFDGVRYLHFGTEWVQGAMRMRKPDWLELEYAQQMMIGILFNSKPTDIVQLGLGTGALTKFCYKNFPDARVTAVDLNPSVIAICESMFKLPPNDERLQVMEMDAMDFVINTDHHNKTDLLQVDLYDATARGPVLDSAEFYQGCADCLRNDGMMTVNLFGDHPSFIKNIKAMKFVFDKVLCLPKVHDGNVVAIAFKKKPVLSFPDLYEMAKKMKEQTKLPTKSWVDGLLHAMS